jgi:alanine dehydrogenase
MKVGIPKEIKNNENRVSVTPSGVASLVAAGHSVFVETGAGLGSGFTDVMYLDSGAVIAFVDLVWQTELIIKVKEPIYEEFYRIKPGQVIFTYFHLAADRELTEALMKSGATCIAYETVALPSGELPLLTPMSEVAGRMAVHEGAKYLEKPQGGRGILLGGVPGVLPANVMILGGGVVGSNAARLAAGLGAQVTILDTSLPRLRYLADVMPANVRTLFSDRHNIQDQIETADLIIGGVLIPGAAAPKLILATDLKWMRQGSVIVDVAVDQGGCIETTHPTTHENPTYVVDGVLHYAVANMPGGVPRTSTLALTNATLPYVLQLANKGWRKALKENAALLTGLNVHDRVITHQAVADAFDLPFTTPWCYIL